MFIKAIQIDSLGINQTCYLNLETDSVESIKFIKDPFIENIGDENQTENCAFLTLLNGKQYKVAKNYDEGSYRAVEEFVRGALRPGLDSNKWIGKLFDKQ